jgi:hypothetical protein
MSDLETELSDTLQPFDEKLSHFTQAGAISDTSLNQLRDQIKKVMIPLLIKTFQCKLDLSQSASLPSRIQSQKNQKSPEEILEQLKTLDNDLKVLLLWCQSCRSQIQRALTAPEEEQKNSVTTSSSAEAHPAVTKSFSEAVSAQSSFFKQQSLQEKESNNPAQPSEAKEPKKWWDKWLSK